MTEITFTDAAIDDLRRIGPDAVPKVLKKVLILLDSPDAGYPLGGELTGFRKLVVGRNTWRIVYRVVDENRSRSANSGQSVREPTPRSMRRRLHGFRLWLDSGLRSSNSPT